MLDQFGNIVLNRAAPEPLSLEFQDVDGQPIALNPTSVRLHVGREADDKPLFTIAPTSTGDKLVFLFTLDHVAKLRRDEWQYVVVETINGVSDPIVRGGTIRAEGFNV